MSILNNHICAVPCVFFCVSKRVVCGRFILVYAFNIFNIYKNNKYDTISKEVDEMYLFYWSILVKMRELDEVE